MFSPIQPVRLFDEKIFALFNQWAGKWIWLDTVGIFFARDFEYVFIFCLLLFVFWNLKKYWRLVLGALISGAFARLVFVNIFYWLLPRARPFIENKVNLLIPYIPRPAFPSGHASFYFALATFVLLALRKIENPPKHWKLIAGLFFLSAFLIALARVFSGLHWPGDILAGIIVGIFSGWLVNKLFQKYLS